MPLLRIETNKKINQEKISALIRTLAKVVSDEIEGTPADFVMVIINQNANIFFRESNDPAAFCTLKVKGLKNWKKRIDVEQLDISISAHVKAVLDLPDNRIFIEVFDMDRKGVFSYFDGVY